jgi:hypothetical protein
MIVFLCVFGFGGAAWVCEARSMVRDPLLVIGLFGFMISLVFWLSSKFPSA